jgi:cytochrome P450 enzyme
MMESALPLRFDPSDPDYLADPHPLLRRFREQAPIYYWESVRGFIAFRYRDVMALIRDPRLATDPNLGAGFPAEFRAQYPDYVTLREHDLFIVPAETHARIRKLVAPAFSPRALEAHRPRVERLIDELLATLPRTGTINVFAEFAQQYPVRVIAGLLTIPPGVEADFLHFADAIIATIAPGLPPALFDAYMPAVSRGLTVIRECIAERREHPIEGDLLTDLITACDRDERLSDGELLSLIAALITGGSDTTVHLTTYTILELLRHPDQLALLRADPALARPALDETLRFNSFGRGGGLPRFAREDFEFAGVSIRRGQPVFLNLMGAFRDPEFVADPDVYDIRRRTHSSPWFGNGPHFCIGASLARMEAETALRSFLARYPAPRLAGPPVFGTHPIFRDIVDLPVRVG